MSNNHPILMKFGTQTKRGMLSSKITKAKMQAIFNTAAAVMVEMEVHAIKWAIVIRF
jgi:hypothetical protein